MIDLAHELDVYDLSILKEQLGKLQMVGRFGYNREMEEFVDIMNGFRIVQNMAEYVEKILQETQASKGNPALDNSKDQFYVFKDNEEIVNAAENEVDIQKLKNMQKLKIIGKPLLGEK